MKQGGVSAAYRRPKQAKATNILPVTDVKAQIMASTCPLHAVTTTPSISSPNCRLLSTI
jgi:hypothetical protein